MSVTFFWSMTKDIKLASLRNVNRSPKWITFATFDQCRWNHDRLFKDQKWCTQDKYNQTTVTEGQWQVTPLSQWEKFLENRAYESRFCECTFEMLIIFASFDDLTIGPLQEKLVKWLDRPFNICHTTTQLHMTRWKTKTTHFIIIWSNSYKCRQIR